MKINLGMLIDTLSSKMSLDIMAKDWIDIEINEVKVIAHGTDTLQSNVLYIADSKIVNALDGAGVINVIAYNSALLSMRQKPARVNLFLVNGKSSETAIMNEVMNVITTIPNGRLPVEFLEKLMSCETLSDFCNEVCDHMRNPMILTDADGRMIGCSKTMMMDDKCWEQLRNTYLAEPSTDAGMAWSRLLMHCNSQGKAAFRLAPNGGRVIICPINSYGTINGFICIPEIMSHRMSGADVELTDLIRAVLITNMKLMASAGNSLTTGQENFLAALVQGHDISPVRLSVMEKAMKISFPDEFIYCFVIRKNDEVTGESSYGEIKKLIPESYNAFSVYYNYDAVVLINAAKPYESPENEFAEFLEPLSKLNVSVGISRPYNQLSTTHECYLQAIAALKYGMSFNPEKSVHTYDGILLYHLLEFYPDQDHIRDLCYPGVLHLQELDRINGTTYLETFRKYIFSGRSLKKTADALYIHRNTVSYHIGKCLEYLKLDLDDGDVLFQITLSLKVINYLNLM